MITRARLFTWLLLPLGLLFLLLGGLRVSAVRNAAPLATLDAAGCRPGQFVRGEITEYAVSSYPGAFGDTYFGDSIHFLNFLGREEYVVYTLPLNDGRYITAMLQNKSLLETLDGYQRGRGEGAELLARVVPRLLDFNYDWYEGAFGTSDPAELEKLLVSETTLREVRPDSGRGLLYAGMLLLVVFCLAQLDLNLRERRRLPPVVFPQAPEELPFTEEHEKNT